MIAYQPGTRRRTILALSVLTAVTLITLDVHASGPISTVRSGVRDVLNPVTGAIGVAVSPVSDWIDGITSAASLKDENARLRRRLDDARGREATARAAIEENRDLMRLLDLPFVGGAGAIAARVMEGAPSNFEFTVQISKGSSDGVAVDMPVVTGAGLVGSVRAVSRDQATVVLLQDPASGVGVQVEKSGTNAVVKGQGDGGAVRLDFVDPGADVVEGEVVYTSGQRDSRFPGGIPVGKVSKVAKTRGDLQQEVLVEPLVDFSRLDYVKVLRPSSGR